MGKPKQATARYRRSKGKGRALQLQAARLKRNIHQLVENSSEVADKNFDLEQVQQQRFDEGKRMKAIGQEAYDVWYEDHQGSCEKNFEG
ncbi:hypothetical protein ACOMHN_059529 [Nucella lapillus]